MKALITILLFTCSFNLCGQWSSIKKFENNYHDFYLRHLDFASEIDGMVTGFVQPFNTLFYQTAVYYTHDAGITWDSIFFDSVTPMGIDVVSSNVAYVNTAALYPINGWTGVIRFVHRTLDGGENWTKHMVDTIGNASQPDPMSFLNDSTGILTLSQGVYFTQNHGSSWQRIDSLYLNKPIINDGIISAFDSHNVYSYNLETFERESNIIDEFVTGSISKVDSYGDTLMTATYGSDGYLFGYSDYNYISLIIDEKPYGNPKILHIPGVGSAKDIQITINNLFLVINGIYRSMDNGESFFKQTTLDPEGFDQTLIERCVFINDTLGYIITWSQDLGYKIQKTINAGGITSDYLPNVVEYMAGIGDKNAAAKFEIYPNPSSDIINIASDYPIESIEIMDLQAKLLKRIASNDKLLSIDISNFDCGSYLIKIAAKNVSIIKKIIVE